MNKKHYTLISTVKHIKTKDVYHKLKLLSDPFNISIDPTYKLREIHTQNKLKLNHRSFHSNSIKKIKEKQTSLPVKKKNLSTSSTPSYYKKKDLIKITHYYKDILQEQTPISITFDILEYYSEVKEKSKDTYTSKSNIIAFNLYYSYTYEHEVLKLKEEYENLEFFYEESISILKVDDQKIQLTSPADKIDFKKLLNLIK